MKSLAVYRNPVGPFQLDLMFRWLSRSGGCPSRPLVPSLYTTTTVLSSFTQVHHHRVLFVFHTCVAPHSTHASHSTRTSACTITSPRHASMIDCASFPNGPGLRSVLDSQLVVLAMR